MTVPELCQLFAKFLDTPLTGPGVERIIQVYLPARDQATFHEMWTHKHLKGKSSTSLSSLDPGAPTSSEQCSKCRKPWTAGKQRCLFCKQPDSAPVPMDTPLSFFNDGTNTWELSVVNGQPKWTVSTARNEEMMKESSAVDASGLGEQPPSTTTLEELSFSEQVPSSTRMSLREEIMDQKMDSELEEIQSKVKAH